MAQQKVGIAMSGGVDSSVTASLLKQNGFAVHGFFMLLPLPGVEKHIKRVQSVADHLNIRLHCIDMQEFFNRTIIDYFINTYREGCTPNPCIICNQQVKFGTLLKIIRNKGMDKMATGHYARIKNVQDGNYILQRGCDPKKDQSYFLCRLAPEQLENIIFPLGDLTKEKVYELAAELNLSGIHGPESQDICFLAGETVSTFFEKQGVDDSPGDIMNAEGTVIGQHRGLWHHTVGQRRGLGLPDTTPWYVKQLDAVNNRLVVCKNDALFTRKIVIRDVLWTDSAVQTPWQGHVQIRGRHQASPASIVAGRSGQWIITFETKQRAVTPGQFAVFYRENSVAGSGIITDHIAGEDTDQ